MAERSLRLRLGLFMGASLIALAGLVVLFGGAPRLFSNDAQYSILFPEAPGVGTGTPIRKSGVRIGQVTNVDLDAETGQVRVRIEIDRKYPPRKSEEAHITRGLLSGDTAIDFLPQIGPDNQPVPRGEEWPVGSDIPGVTPVTPRTIINANALANAQQSLDKITRTFEQFEKVAPKLERAAGEAADLFKDVREFIPELRRTNQRLQNLIGADLPARPPRVGPVVPVGFVMNAAQPPDVMDGNMRGLIRDAQESLRDIRATLRRLEPDLSAAVKGARETFDNVNDVLSAENRKQFAELLKNLNTVSGSIVKFVATLGSALDQAEKTLKNVDTQVSQVGLVVGDIRAVTLPLSTRAEGLVKSVVDSADDLSKLLKEIRAVTGAFAKEDGAIQQLLTDPSLYRNIDDAAASLARIMTRAEKITRDLEVFSDKIARRPELIGVGGALRPSAGLKDLPGAPSYRHDWPPASGAKSFSGPTWLQPPQEETRWGAPPPIMGSKP